MKDHRDHIPKDDRELLREIDLTKLNARGFRIFQRKEPRKPIQTKVYRVGGSKARKILKRQR